MARTKGDASSAGALACRTPTTAKSAHCKKKTYGTQQHVLHSPDDAADPPVSRREMVVRRLSTWARRRRTCFTNGKSMGSKSDEMRLEHRLDVVPCDGGQQLPWLFGMQQGWAVTARVDHMIDPYVPSPQRVPTAG
jgi:hypothetical protein